MILHIRLRPDGNGDVFTGTPEEIKKRFNDFKKSVERSGPRPNFHTRYEIQVWYWNSKYVMFNDVYTKTWDIYRRGPTGFCIAEYRTFGACLNKLVKLIEKEGYKLHE